MEHLVDQQRKRSDPERESAQISRVECSRTGTEAKFRESKKRPSFRHQLLFRLTGEKWLKVKTSARLLGQNGRRVVSTDGMRFYFWNQQPSSNEKRGKKYLERSAEGCRGCAFCSGRLIICAASPTREPTQRDQTSEEETRCGRVKLTDQQTATRNASEESRNQKDQKFFFLFGGEKMARVFLIIILSNWWMCYCCLERKATIRLPDLSAPQQRPLKSNTQHAKLPWPFCYFI